MYTLFDFRNQWRIQDFRKGAAFIYLSILYFVFFLLEIVTNISQGKNLLNHTCRH